MAAGVAELYRENLMRLIRAKLKGRTPKLQERETPQQGDVVDLMARLRASLAGRMADTDTRRTRKTTGAGTGQQARSSRDRKTDGRKRKVA